MENLFISFLGTGNYQPVKYDGMEDKLVYVQTATLLRKCSNWQPENSRALFLCTPKAKDKSWQGLKDELQANQVAIPPQCVDIEMPRNEEQMWELFTQLVNLVEDKNRIVFDITHSFRYLPMLFTVLIQYLQIVKSIKLDGVFYGAYQEESEQAPLVELTSFMALYDWSRAINDFICYGRAGELSEMALAKTNTLLAKVEGANENARAAKKLFAELRKFSANVRLVRGKNLCKERILSSITDNLKVLNQGMLPPLHPLLKRLHNSFADFRDEDVLNGISAAEWAFEHGMVQQGITLLQETIITWLARKPEVQNEFRSSQDEQGDASLSKDCRLFCSQIFSVFGPEHPPENKWKSPIKERKATAEKVKRKYLNEEILKICYNLTQIRNDMNHGGYAKDAAKPEGLETRSRNIMKQVNEFLAAVENPKNRGGAAKT